MTVKSFTVHFVQARQTFQKVSDVTGPPSSRQTSRLPYIDFSLIPQRQIISENEFGKKELKDHKFNKRAIQCETNGTIIQDITPKTRHGRSSETLLHKHQPAFLCSHRHILFGESVCEATKNTGFYMGDTNYWKRVTITIGHNVENFQSREKKKNKVKRFYKSHKMETIVK